ncbi:MAG: hypothetical protein ACKO54_03870, partial [Alphaproteobacteria bacterium]
MLQANDKTLRRISCFPRPGQGYGAAQRAAGECSMNEPNAGGGTAKKLIFPAVLILLAILVFL